mmetsp:Transcript_17214/g.35770  ORF Transcript_17214/g.35770 Transcript_17214/m.35770 type:complete len:417 (-) Transcript_17214:1785-3035(-)
MGKNRHTKDRLFVSRSEMEGSYGGKSSADNQEVAVRAALRAGALPIDHCAIGMRPIETPVVAPDDGSVFELTNIVPYLEKHGKNPISGVPMTTKDLIRLNFSRDEANQLQCPVLMKTLGRHSKIVAIMTSGNVYSAEAVEKLNIKANNFTDLLDGQPFKKKDVMILQDPSSPVIIKKACPAKSPEKDDKGYSSRKRMVDSGAEKTSNKKSTVYTTGRTAMSLTSTSLAPITKQEMRDLTEEEIDSIRYKRVRTKGYVSLETTLGSLEIELHCDAVGKTCENFVLLAQKGRYNGTVFHRLIPGFMIQGGDPEGSSSGGKSAWGGLFRDEFKSFLRHDQRGILSSANRGPDTNGSQFFITFGPCPHLDDVHTVFGKVVGHQEVLDKLERIPTDRKDRPLEQMVLKTVQVMVNPFDGLE